MPRSAQQVALLAGRAQPSRAELASQPCTALHGTKQLQGFPVLRSSALKLAVLQYRQQQSSGGMLAHSQRNN